MDRRELLRAGVLAIGAPFLNRGRFSLHAGMPQEYSARTLDLVQRSTVVDMLGLVTLNFRKLRDWQRGKLDFRTDDIRRLKDSGVTILHPAVGYNRGDIFRASYDDLSGWNAFVDAHPDVFLRIRSAADIDRVKASGRIGILLGQQNSGHFRTVDDVDAFYAMGQRVSQLSYYRNRLGYGCYDDADMGLTAYGCQVVQRMNRVGMAVDISHCGDRTTLEALDASSSPVLITHSNCRSLANHRRCKTDEAIRRMAAKGGVMGVTMVGTFVCSSRAATINDVVNHIDHIARIAGMEYVGLGSDVDLDGRDANSANPKFDLEGIHCSRKIYDLVETMVRRKYTDQHIQMVLGTNFQRALRKVTASSISGPVQS